MLITQGGIALQRIKTWYSNKIITCFSMKKKCCHVRMLSPNKSCSKDITWMESLTSTHEYNPLIQSSAINPFPPEPPIIAMRIHVLSTLCDVIRFNSQGQLCPLANVQREEIFQTIPE